MDGNSAAAAPPPSFPPLPELPSFFEPQAATDAAIIPASANAQILFIFFITILLLIVFKYFFA